MRVERIVLEDHRQVPVPRRLFVDAAAIDEHVARRDVLQADEHMEDGRLASPRRSDQDDELHVGDLEADVVDGQESVAVLLDDVLHADFCHSRTSPSWAGLRAGQPFTAPAVRPATMRRWNTSTKMTTGMVTTTEAAMIAVTGDWNCDAPVKNERAAGTVRARSVDVSEIASRNSFQQKKNVRIVVVNTPGAASGTMTLRNACHAVAPSTWAACSISQGICRKNADIVQMDSGSAKVRYGMIRPIQVS